MPGLVFQSCELYISQGFTIGTDDSTPRTNESGAYCHDSCRTQAWSSSTILDLLDDVAKLQQK